MHGTYDAPKKPAGSGMAKKPVPKTPKGGKAPGKPFPAKGGSK
jgi:hypothetical protein